MSDDDTTFTPPPLPILTQKQQQDYDSLCIEMGLKADPRAQRRSTEPPNKKARANRSRYSAGPRSAWDRVMSTAKYARRAVNPHLQLVSVMTRGAIKHWGAIHEEDNANALSAAEIRQQNEQVKQFDKILKNLRDLSTVFQYMYLESADDDKSAWITILTLMHKDAVQVRANDTSRLKTKHEYFLPNDRTDVLYPPLRNASIKTDRDLKHPMLRHLILPPHHRRNLPPLEFRQPDPNAPSPVLSSEGRLLMEMIASGSLLLTVNDFPSAFYEEGSFDPEDEANGLFRGYLMERVMRHIWTSPDSAFVAFRKGLRKDCNANLHRQYVVTPEMVGYVACQVRTMLSNEDWREIDGEFDYEELFKLVVQLLRPDEATPARVRQWAEDTLNWFQEKTFGNYSADETEDESTEDVPAVFTRILQQRAD
ncbi:hypothetical protein GGX14DRAFT_555744 [Mycena pura]|uniref:Uncharacterized protein n=1 Tax=Mycena pura TaxID=153505 RepID=A0AAD7E4J0_9AGAR|nr:hypothetical protein GGX14DRAFT_555744 [Mycena pura]